MVVGDDGVDATLASLADQRDADTTWSVLARGDDPLPAEVDEDRLVGFLQAGDVLSPLASRAYAAAAGEADIIYADHDRLDAEGRQRDPWHVPDWSPDRLLAQDYIRGAFVARDGKRLRELLVEPPDASDPAWRYSLSLALTEGVGAIEHVPHVLWSEPLTDDPARQSAEAAAVRAELERRGCDDAIVHSHAGASGPIRRIEWPQATTIPRVSVIVPTTGRSDVVDMILATLTEQTAYPDLEVIFVDNGRGAHPEGIARLADSGAT